MKFTKTLLACAGILAMSTGLTSCLGGGSSDMTFTQTLTGFFNVTFTSPYDEPQYFNGVGYQVLFNQSQLTANITLDGLKLPGGTYSQLKFNDVKWTMPNYWRTIKLTSAMPVAMTSAPIFDTFNMRVLDRYVLGGVYAPLIGIDYNVMGLTVKSIPSGVICEGTTSITDQNGTVYKTDLKSEKYPTYGVQLISNTSANLNNESERKAILQMANFSLDGTGSTHTLVVKNIAFDIDYSGQARLKVDEEPLQEATGTNSTSTTAYGDYVVTNLQGSVDSMNNMQLTFTASSEKEGKSYRVSVYCVTPDTSSTTPQSN